VERSRAVHMGTGQHVRQFARLHEGEQGESKVGREDEQAARLRT
jgi:hypothetical protein